MLPPVNTLRPKEQINDSNTMKTSESLGVIIGVMAIEMVFLMANCHQRDVYHKFHIYMCSRSAITEILSEIEERKT